MHNIFWIAPLNSGFAIINGTFVSRYSGSVRNIL